MDSQSRRVKAHQRHLQALELRQAGATYQVIADQLGYADAHGAHRAVASALKASLREPAEGLRALELVRLDSMLLALWKRVRNGDERAVDRALKIEERRARLLGLDAPQRRSLAISLEAMDAEIVRLEAELARSDAPDGE